jgi:hypothetical protein
MGNFRINEIIFYFVEVFEKKINSIVENFKKFNYKNLESNHGVVQISRLVCEENDHKDKKRTLKLRVRI